MSDLQPVIKRVIEFAVAVTLLAFAGVVGAFAVGFIKLVARL